MVRYRSSNTLQSTEFIRFVALGGTGREATPINIQLHHHHSIPNLNLVDNFSSHIQAENRTCAHWTAMPSNRIPTVIKILELALSIREPQNDNQRWR